MILKKRQDAFGQEIYDYFKKQQGYEIVERDDGYFDLSYGPRQYFAEYPEWQLHEKQAMKYVRGRVLDIGCGAGRHSLYLQKRGFDVLGIDNSPGAVEVCRMRGLRKTRVLSVTEITSRVGKFDTILMFGNNFGLFGSFKRARWLLRRFHKLTSAQARIIAESRDPYQTNLPEHLDYHRQNRKNGRMSGQIRIRVRYKHYATPWFDYLMVSQAEMKKILRGTGWMVKRFLTSRSAMYIAVIEKA
jgi:SAM-dependent methyltransferase